MDNISPNSLRGNLNDQLVACAEAGYLAGMERLLAQDAASGVDLPCYACSPKAENSMAFAWPLKMATMNASSGSFQFPVQRAAYGRTPRDSKPRFASTSGRADPPSAFSYVRRGFATAPSSPPSFFSRNASSFSLSIFLV